MPRLLAIAAVAGGVAAFALYLHALGRGPFASLESRHLRERKDRSATPAAIEPMTHAAFLALPRGTSVAEYSALERRAVSLEGRVRTLLRATDGDFHAELEPIPASASAPRGPAVTAELTPVWHGDALDGWGYERLVEVFRPDLGGVTPWDGGPARVRLSGWLLYDRESDVLPRLLGIPLPVRTTEWEIHPVTKIERWDEPLAAWVEVKR